MKNNIKQLRQEKNISVEEIAYKLNVTAQTVYNWEIGRNKPNKATLVLLSVILGVKEEDIFL